MSLKHLSSPGTKEGRAVISEKGYLVHPAQFDIAVLIECAGVDDAYKVRRTNEYKNILKRLELKSKYVHAIAAKNANRIDAVSKDTNGVFLFNYFYAKNTQTILDVWEYTAGWWTQKANLTNSIFLIKGLPIYCGSDSIPATV
jgi:uncharacterized protein YegP (UPF0339 family)